MVKKEDVLEYLRKNPGALGDEFIVKRRAPTKKHTFEVEEAILERFFAEAQRKDLKIKEAIHEALSAWLGRAR